MYNLQKKKNVLIKNKFLNLDEKKLYTFGIGVQSIDLKTQKEIWSTSLKKNKVNVRYGQVSVLIKKQIRYLL